MKKKKELFTREVTPIIKGFAIIMMFSLHLLKTDWMIWPEWIIDFSLSGKSLATVLANTGDICIGIFAFVTGYSWWEGFQNKTPWQRIGALYFSYWIAMFLFCLPIRYLVEYSDGFTLFVSYSQLAQSLLAVASPSVTYCWYVSFFAIAVLTYQPCISLLNRIRLNGFLDVFLVCVLGMVMRVFSRIVYQIVPFPYWVLTLLSHYFQWMPVIVTGAIAKRDRLLERMHRVIVKRFGKEYSLWGAIASVGLVLVLKIIVQFVLNIYSNFDSFLMLPFMYGLVVIARKLCVKKYRISSWLEKMGNASLYMWLTHSVLQYESVQNVLYRMRIPLLIVLTGLWVMLPIGQALNTAEKKMKKCCRVLNEPTKEL